MDDKDNYYVNPDDRLKFVKNLATSHPLIRQIGVNAFMDFLRNPNDDNEKKDSDDIRKIKNTVRRICKYCKADIFYPHCKFHLFRFHNIITPYPSQHFNWDKEKLAILIEEHKNQLKTLKNEKKKANDISKIRKNIIKNNDDLTEEEIVKLVESVLKKKERVKEIKRKRTEEKLLEPTRCKICGTIIPSNGKRKHIEKFHFRIDMLEEPIDKYFMHPDKHFTGWAGKIGENKFLSGSDNTSNKSQWVQIIYHRNGPKK